ncbi:MAG: ATP phosphoribosyltransferase regulatory subunit [Actinobacteria bacterium]|nr:MAG: ATP phosphoribosyltransferase regulatory subunit [Actinomycetota bacterium]
MRPQTPRGFRDVLFQEAAEREAVSRAMGDVFAAWGYAPVETPVVEEYAVLAAGVGAAAERTAFRLFDLDGSLLALRPEMTVPIARVAASRLAEQPGPHRVRYVAPVFREHASLRGQARQFTQAGIEFVGAGGPVADAEVVSLAVEALEAAGLTAYTIGIGTVEVLRDLIAASGADGIWGGAVIAAAHQRNLVELERLASDPSVRPEVAAALMAAPRIRGGREALDQCRDLLVACGCTDTLRNLRETYRVLEGLGYADRVTVDFGIMRSFDYYTGFVLEAYAPGLGLPLGGGGRYDRLLATFGAPAPAAGFALGVERVMIALAEQGATPAVSGLDAVIGGLDSVAVFSAARDLRAAGWRVAPAVGQDGIALVREAERADAAEALVADDGAIIRLDRAGERALPLEKPLPSAPGSTWAQKGGAR